MLQGDGSVINSYFNISSMPTGKDVYQQGKAFLVGQIDKIHFTDDSTNVSKKFIEYDVIVKDSQGGQSTYRNVRCLYRVFGTSDFQEVVLESNDFAFQDKLDSKTFFKHKNGCLVILAFLHGNIDKPFIVGAFHHPRMPAGATREEGIRLKGEFRGLQYEINKLGEFSLVYKGNRHSNAKFARPETAPTSISISKAGALTIEDKENQILKIDRVTKTISLEQYSGSKSDEIGGDPEKPKQNPQSQTTPELINSVKLDKETQTITIAVGKDQIIQTFDGQAKKLSIALKSGLIIDIDGANDKVEIQDSVGGKIKVEAGKLALGTSSVEVLDVISQTLNLLTTDLGNLGYPLANSAQYAALKTLIDTIKGTV